jgi:transcriptional regulator with XRE-family HTH domain
VEHDSKSAFRRRAEPRRLPQTGVRSQRPGLSSPPPVAETKQTTQLPWNILCTRCITRAAHCGGVGGGRSNHRQQFAPSLHLVAAITLATMVSKCLDGVVRSTDPVEVISMSTTFSARLNRLFDTVYPPGRGPHTSAEVIAALKAEGVTMSAPYLSQLRSGNRTNPSSATMAALANFFRIRPAYFTDDEYYEKLDKELSWLLIMRDEGVRRIAVLASGLSAQAQQDVVHRVDELRRKEDLDA